jgi:CBS-domain-containing membrane protein
MINLSERLATLTARDIMTEKLVLLEETDTIQRAANLFRDLHISGAPVINAAGEPIGLLSVTDIVPAVVARMGVPAAGPRPQTREAEWEEICQILNSGSNRSEAGELVTRWMSRRLVSVRETTPLFEVARVLCDGHWHRVTVIDASGRLQGIVSTMDVLAALVQAADEEKGAGR